MPRLSLLRRHPSPESRQQGGHAVGKVESRRSFRVLPDLAIFSGVAVDIHQSGTYIGALGIQYLTALRDGGGTHLAITGNFAVPDKQDCFRNQMVTHHKLCVDNCQHHGMPAFLIYYNSLLL